MKQSMRAVITGAGSGLGRAIASLVASRGGRVLVADVDEAAAAETAAQLRSHGAEPLHLACDVREAGQVEALARAADEAWGGADLIVNNAGVAVTGNVGEVPLEDWRWALDVNLRGVLHGCHSFVPRFRARGSGAVLNVASAAGLLSPAHVGPYNVSKAGVVALTETLYAELRGSGVTTTVLCPTFFVTNLMRDSRGPDSHRAAATRLMERSRYSADDIAVAALRAVERGRLYAVPMRDGRMLWRVKRLMPQRYVDLLARFRTRAMPAERTDDGG